MAQYMLLVHEEVDEAAQAEREQVTPLLLELHAALREEGRSHLGITALGRQEEWEDSPDGYPQTAPYTWWNYHDAYGAAD